MAESNQIKVTEDGGILKEILKEGTGTESPKKGDKV